VYLRVLRFIIL